MSTSIYMQAPVGKGNFLQVERGYWNGPPHMLADGRDIRDLKDERVGDHLELFRETQKQIKYDASMSEEWNNTRVHLFSWLMIYAEHYPDCVMSMGF